MHKFLNYAASVFLLAAVALVGWNLQKTTALSSNVDVIIERVAQNREGNTDDHRRMMDLFAAMMPRRESELRMAQIELKLNEVEAKIAELQMKLRGIQ